jgi:hypothetical protein
MKSKAIIAMAVAGAFWSAGSIANPTGAAADAVRLGQAPYAITSPSSSDESSFGMSTLTSLDTRTGGYKGWGPMANFMGPDSVDESNPLAQIDEQREHQQQLAEVKAVRDQVWVANAPLRAEYENIGATRSEAGGFGRFFSRGHK